MRTEGGFMSGSISLRVESGSSLFEDLEQEYNSLTGCNPNLVILPTDDSDGEESRAMEGGYPILTHGHSPKSADMTIKSHYCGKEIYFKGNQLILWARGIMEKVIRVPEREVKIQVALSTRCITIRSSDDWLVYEGMFNNFGCLLAKKSDPFHGIVTIAINRDASTTVEFKDKVYRKRLRNGEWKESAVLYAYVNDPLLINHLNEKFQGSERITDYGLSYNTMVKIIERIKLDSRKRDAELAIRQLNLFKGSARGPITLADRFLSFFNAVLFGSEASRNSLSFLTGILILDRIAKEQLTYMQSFQTPNKEDIDREVNVPFAAYPMASPYAEGNNFKGYSKLLEYSKQEEIENKLSSSIGMKSSRQRLLWTQIHVKEAVLLKFWAKDIGDQPNWTWLCWPRVELGGYGPVENSGHAVEFARRFVQRVVSVLHQHFPRVVKDQFVYSPDEMYGLGWFKPSDKIWKDSQNPDSTDLDFNPTDWYVTTENPVKVQKRLFDVMCEYYDEFGEPFSDSETEI